MTVTVTYYDGHDVRVKVLENIAPPNPLPIGLGFYDDTTKRLRWVLSSSDYSLEFEEQQVNLAPPELKISI